MYIVGFLLYRLTLLPKYMLPWNALSIFPRYYRDLPGHEHTGGTEEGSIDGANKTMDSKVNVAVVLAGG
jgi:hypothetical protein